MPVLKLASADERKQLQLSNAEYFPYEGDSHLISMQGKGAAYLVGGNFTQCLCNAVRSLIVHQRSDNPFEMFFFTDAIYEMPIPSVLASNRRYQERKSRVLSQIMNDLSDEQLVSYLKNDWLSSDSLPCPLYEPALIVPARPSYRYEIFRGTRSLGVVGNGAKLINLHLLQTRDLR